jgi:hypothetical protein
MLIRRKQMMITLPAWAAVALALPHSNLGDGIERRAGGAIEQFPADVRGPDRNALKPAPADLPNDLRGFLEKYQPLSNVASEKIGPKSEALFSSVGHCFAEFPCFSVERAAAATIGDKEEVTEDQVSAILDKLLASSPTVTFEPSHEVNSLSGLKLTANQATLEVIAFPGTMAADFLAGMVFDMFKMQHDNPETNSIRAVQAKTDGKERPFVALCLYPEGADPTQTHNFCLGNNLDGSPALPAQHTKRFLGDLLNTLRNTGCGLISIPIICDGDSAPAPDPYPPPYA